MPFVWSQSASRVNSYLLSVEIRNASTQEELEITNLTKPLALWIRKSRDTPLKPTKGEVQHTETLEHSFEVKDNRSSINIEIDLLGVITEHPLLVVYLRKEEPTMDGEERHKMRVIPPLLHRNNESSVQNSSTNTTDKHFTNPTVLFFSNKDFNGTAAGKYSVTIEYNGTVSGAEVHKESKTLEYLLSIYTSECLYWNEQSEAWVEDGCVVRYFL